MRYSVSIQRIMLLAFSIVIFAAPAVWAGSRDHMDGLFLRLSAGGGAASTEATYQGVTEKYSGTSGDINLAIGGIVAPGLALHGTMWGWAITEVDWEFDGLKVATNADMTLVAFGAGITYYFMPSNFYLSGSLGVSKLSLDAGPVTLESDAGFALDLTAGKEWWVGNHWGLGAALGLSIHSIPDGNYDVNWSGPGFGVRFSATYN